MDILGTILMLIGTAFILLGAIGIVRLPDLFTRMHAATKAGTFGVGLTLLSVICFYGHLEVAARAVTVLIFVALTAPVSAHTIGRAAYFAGVRKWEGTFVDQLQNYRITKLHRRSGRDDDRASEQPET